MKKQFTIAAAVALTAAAMLPAGATLFAPDKTAENGPSRVTAGGSALYGVLVYSYDDDAKEGVYEFTKSGAVLKFKRPNGYDFTGAWLKDGRLCGYAEDKYGMTVRGRVYEEIEFSTGRLLSSTEMEVQGTRFETAVLDEDSNVIYGYGYTTTGKRAFLKAPASDPTSIEAVKDATEDESFLAITFNQADRKVYGITKDFRHQLVTVDADGAQTVVMTVPNSSDVNWEYVTGLAYAPKENLFYWNRYEGEESLTSSLVTIDPVKKTLTVVRKYSNEEQFSVLFCTDAPEIAGQPAKPVIDAVSFPEGALSGSMTFTLPSADVDGGAISGDLDWTVTLDDAVYDSGSSAAGSKKSVAFNSVEQGLHTFAVTVSKGGVSSEKSFVNAYVGFDTPVMPRNVSLSADGLSWDAVTEGVNGGYIDIATLKYKISLNGVAKGETQATEMKGLLPSDGALEWYQASVVAVNRGLDSEASVSNRELAGAPLQLPVDLVPTKEEFNLMRTFDLDGDSYSWRVRDGFMESQWCLSKDGGDDWVVLPPMAFDDAGAVYSLEYKAKRNMSETGREKLEVLLGRTPDPAAMTTVIVDAYEPLDDYSETRRIFNVPEAGVWYIAFRAMPVKYEVGIGTGMDVKDIKVSKSDIVSSSPGAVTDLTAVRGDKGALNATVSFRMPSLTFSGEPLTAAEVTAVVEGTESRTVTGAPGSLQSVTVPTRQGQNVITVTTSAGTVAGTPATVEVYTGVVVPGIVKDLDFAIQADMLSVKMTWNTPDGLTEGYVDPATTFYTVYEAVQSFYDMEWRKVGVTNPGVTEFTYRVEDGTPQKAHTLVVMAQNVAGHGDDMSGGEVLLGTPYALPMTEDFENPDGDFRYTPWVRYQPEDNYSANWWVWPAENVLPDAEDEGECLVGKPKEADTYGLMGMPAFAAGNDGVDVEVSLDVLINENTPEVTVSGICSGMDSEVEVGSIKPGNAGMLQTVSFKLPAQFSDASWIQLYFKAYYAKSTNLLVIDRVKVVKTEGSGVGEADGRGVSVAAAEGGIRVMCAAETPVTVCSLSGMVMFSDTVSGDCTVRLPGGVYFVRAGAESLKVIVR